MPQARHTPNPLFQHPKVRRALRALLGAAACFAVCFFVWLSAVRPASGKSLSAHLSDDYTVYAPVGQSFRQTFTYDEDLLAIALVFDIPGEQPAGELQLSLSDAATGEVLAVSTGEMANILPGQYTGLGLSQAVGGQQGRQYVLTVTPHYTGAGRLALGRSAVAVQPGWQLTVDGQAVDGTAALLVTYQQIGGFLSRFYWCVALAVAAAVGLALWLAGGAKLCLPRAAFVLVLLFGLLYAAVLPPYAAPDEQYHINQAFTLACRWANAFSDEDWRMGDVPLTTSYRREHDEDSLLQDEKTTVFTWREAARNLFTTTADAFDSHLEREEAQTDRNPTLYLASAAAVFLGFLLHLGFVPVLYLGRLANLLLFALLAALAVWRAPFGKRVFLGVSLLPMTLHLAASFSRDGPLMGFCLLFTALCLEAVYGAAGKAVGAMPPLWLTLLGVSGLVLAPAKLVYLPLTMLVLAIPAARLGLGGRHKPVLPVKFGYLALCLAFSLLLSGSLLAGAASAGTAATPAAGTAPTSDAAPDSAAGTAARDAGHAQNAPQSKAAQGEAAAGGASASAAAQPDAAALDPDAAALLSARTAEGFVRRLYYYGENRLDEPQSEVDFWVQALNEQDVTPALLGQSFFFGPDAHFAEEALISAASQVFLCRDILQTDASLVTLAREKGVEQAYKALYSSAEAAAVLGPSLPHGNYDPDRVPLDRAALTSEVEAAREVRSRQSVATGADAVCFTPGYCLAHLPSVMLLLANSAIQNGDHYLRTLVGGSLSYYNLDLAWGWVLACYLLLALAMLPDRNAALPAVTRRQRALGLAAALACCGLVVLGCITWTPTYYQTIYGLQGRYFLPVLPLILLLAAPRRIRAERAEPPLLAGFAFVNAGVLVNAMLAVIAR